jgi:hypothetical protein
MANSDGYVAFERVHRLRRMALRGTLERLIEAAQDGDYTRTSIEFNRLKYLSHRLLDKG